MTTWGDRMNDIARAAGSIPFGDAHDASALQRSAREATAAHRIGKPDGIPAAWWVSGTPSTDALRDFAVLRDAVMRVENALRAEHVDETTILRVVRRLVTGSPETPDDVREWRNPEGWPR